MRLALIGFRRDEKGVTALEYGLIVALIASAIIATLGTLGTSLGTELTGLAKRLSAANTAGK